MPTSNERKMLSSNEALKELIFVWGYTLVPFNSIIAICCIENGLTLTARGSRESDVCRRQILTTKVDPRTLGAKICLMAVDPYHRYSK